MTFSVPILCPGITLTEMSSLLWGSPQIQSKALICLYKKTVLVLYQWAYLTNNLVDHWWLIFLSNLYSSFQQQKRQPGRREFSNLSQTDLLISYNQSIFSNEVIVFSSEM